MCRDLSFSLKQLTLMVTRRIYLHTHTRASSVSTLTASVIFLLLSFAPFPLDALLRSRSRKADVALLFHRMCDDVHISVASELGP